MYPGIQIVSLMLSWLTDGLIAPGVHFGSGNPPFVIWHWDGIVVALLDTVLFVLDSVDSLDIVVLLVVGLSVRWLDNGAANDDLGIVLFAFCCVWVGCCVVEVVLCLGCGFLEEA